MSEIQINVLLVEDDPDDALLVQEMLGEAEGVRFEVRCARRFSEASALVRGDGFDVILLDLSLPDRQGLQTLAGARTAAPDLPIVVLTGLDDQAMAFKALQRGAQDYLVKGQDTASSLARSIRYAIARHRMEMALEDSIQWEQQSWARTQEMRDYSRYVAMSKEIYVPRGLGAGAGRLEILSEAEEEGVDDLLPSYRELVQSYLDSYASPEGRPVRRLHRLASALAGMGARSVDLMRLHLDLLAEFSHEGNPDEYHDLLNESRLVLIEMMAALLDAYRERAAGGE